MFFVTQKKRVLDLLFILLLLIAFPLLLTHSALAQRFGNTDQFLSEQYTIEQWGIEDGLPVNSVYDILKAKNGYLWLASHDGLIRFNGIEFKIFRASDYNQLRGNRIQYIVEAADSSIIIQSEGLSITRLKNGVFTHLVTLDPQKLGNGTAMGFFEDSAGNIWLGGDSGIHVFRNGTLEEFQPQIIDFPVTKVTYAAPNEVWFYSPNDNTVYRYKNGAIHPIAFNEKDNRYHSLVEHDSSIWLTNKTTLYNFRNEKLDTVYHNDSLTFTFLGVNANNRLNIATRNNGYFIVRESELIKKNTISDSGTFTSSPYLLEKGGAFWIVTENELYKNDELIFKDDVIIEDVIKDEEDNIWIATSNQGLIRLRQHYFKTYSTEQGIPSKNIYPIYQTIDSTIWIGTFGNGFVSWKNGAISSEFLASKRDKKHFIQSFESENDSTLLIGILDKGIYALNTNSEKIQQYELPEKLLKSDIFSIYFDSRKRLWIGSNPTKNGGLFLKEKDTWIQVSGDLGVPYTKVRFILEASNGDIWFATQGMGIIRFNNKRYYRMDTNSGLSSDFPRALYLKKNAQTGEEILWVGYEDIGLQRIPLIDGAPDFKNSINYSVKDGLFDNTIHIILEDDNERFWINTNRGIFWVSISELEDFYYGKNESINTIGYTEKDGLLNREGNGGVQPVGLKAFDGSIWFATQDGVVSFHPDSIVSNIIIPPISIEEVISDKRNIPLIDKHVFLSSNERDIEIAFASLSFSNPKKNQYRFILDGFDSEWQSVGSRNIAYYTNLGAGTYTFKVQGSNNEGVWNSNGDEIRITVAPVFYETFWFYFLLLLFISAVIISIIEVRNLNFRKREAELKRAVDTRTKELLEEKNKTELQAQQLEEANQLKSKLFDNISHELRTPLSLIITPLERFESEKVKTNTKEWKQQIKLVLRNSHKLLALSDQLLEVSKIENGQVSLEFEKVPIYPFLKRIFQIYREACSAKEIRLHFSSNINTGTVCIDKEKIEIALGNLISNAIKFTPKGGKIYIHLKENEAEFCIEIKDSGIGIPQESLPKIFDRFYQVSQKGGSFSEGFGVGLSIVKEFIKLHSGTIKADSILNIGSVFSISLPKKNIPALKPSNKYVELKYDAKNPPVIDTDLVVNQSTLPINETLDKTTILIVDDNKDMRTFISSTLENEYEIIESANGKIAYQKIIESPPDLIISDILMPEMDGIQLNKLLKSNENTASIPFVFLTGRIEKSNRIKSIKEGADVYLTKPFDTEELKSHVQNLISSRLNLRNLLLKELKKPDPGLLPKKEYTSEDSFLKDLYEIMSKEFSNPELSVQTIQEKLFMSRSSFYRTINEKTGLNTQQFINSYRLQKAREMLINEKGSISEIAYACGFNSLSYFSRSFKEKFKQTPSQFLKKTPRIKHNLGDFDSD